MSFYENNNALVIKSFQGKRSLVQKTLPSPEPRCHQAVIRVTYAAQNSMDGRYYLPVFTVKPSFQVAGRLRAETVWALDSGGFSDGSVLGCDFVGTVEKIGDQVSLVKNGDTIGGIIYGGRLLYII